MCDVTKKSTCHLPNNVRLFCKERRQYIVNQISYLGNELINEI